MLTKDRAPHHSRRNFLQLSAGAAAAAAVAGHALPAAAHALGTPELLQVAPERRSFPKDAIKIDQNENPLGPCTMAREAVANMAAQGGRYSAWLTDELVNTFAAMEGLKPEYVHLFPGSGGPLHFTVLSFTSPTKSYVTADPGYESGMHAAKFAGARVVTVPLTKTYAHDVKAMLAAAPDAGLFYICTPNNPTGSLTPHSDIEYLVANKPKDSVVLVDEAYIHFSDSTSALDLVKADKDVVVLRTFSKIYGMAGLRAGFAIARPDLLEKIGHCSGYIAMPITAVAAATASLRHEGLVSERKQINTRLREETFAWLRSRGYAVVPSQSNCFMVDAKRPTKEVIAAMAVQNVFIGRAWPIWPTHVRITVGTQDEMAHFRSAFEKVMTGAVVASASAMATLAAHESQMLDGITVPARFC